MDNSNFSLPLQDSTDTRQKLSTRKRREPPQQTVELLKPPVKQSKLCNELSDTFAQQPPVAFWDGLSKIWLEPHALKELNCRNAKLASRQPRIKSKPSLLAADYLSRASQVELAQIKAFAQQSRRGGPDLMDLRGYPTPEKVIHKISSRHSSQSSFMSSTNETSDHIKSKRVSVYARNFEQHLIDHGIHPDGCGYPDGYKIPLPVNLEEIQSRLVARRPSLSPSHYPDSAFYDSRRANQQAVS